MKNKEIAQIFNRIGTLLEIKGEIVFKIRAYYKAAEAIEALAEDIEKLRSEGRLSEISGVGKTLQEKIGEYLDTGKIAAYEKLIKEIPESLFEVIAIPSIGPKKAKLFFENLKVKNVDDLAKALESGQLDGLPGIKEKTIENIRKGIEIVRKGQERMTIGKASRICEEIIAQLRNIKEVKDVAAAGSLRRGKETIGDIDILINASDSAKVMDAFVKFPQVAKINAQGPTKSSVLTKENVQVDLRVVEPQCYGAALLHFTGSKNFNVRLRQIALKKDMKVSEYGIFSVKGDKEKFLAGKTEEDCFKALGLRFVAPELREDIGETELFDSHDQIKTLPALIEQSDIKGEFHVHSTYSDGKNTIEEMVKKAQSCGYKYLAISDHSQRLKIAGGVSPENLKKKKKEIDALNKKLSGFRVLFGSEVEIDTKGNLDYNDIILSEFDVVIAAVHSGFEQSSQQLTRRIVNAIKNKHVHMIAHPTGVHLGKREPYNLDFQEVCKAAAGENVCLEINAFPIRLDLNSANVYFARKMGVKFAVNTDAHNVDHMDYMRFGVGIARRGWLTKKDVLNTQTCEQVLKNLKK